MLVLVVGASGYIGRQLLPLLLSAGHEVRCLIRRPGDKAKLPPGVEVCLGDVLEQETLSPALRGVDCVYYLVHSMAAGEDEFVARDRKAAYNFAVAAEAAGVRRVVY